MSKKFSMIIVIILLVITVLTGCGVNDLGYLKLSREISKLSEFNFENEMKLELSEELTGKNHDVGLKLIGSVNLKELNSMYVDLNVLINYNDIETKDPINLKIVDNKIYVSNTSLLEIVKFASEIGGSEGYGLNNKVIEELYNNDLKDVEYILLADLGDENDISAINNVTYKEMTDKSIDYLTKAFNGFDSKIITKTSKGYSLELNYEGIIPFAENLLNYLDKNREIVFDETIKYFEEIYSTIAMTEFTEEDKTTVIKELNDSRQDFYDFIDIAIAYIKTEEFKSYLDVIKGSKIKEEIYKEGNSYIEKSEIEVVVNEVKYKEGYSYIESAENEIKMGRLLSNTKITPADVEKVVLNGNVIEIEKIEALYNTTENRINPVKRMELNWFAESTELQVNKRRLDENVSFDFQPYTIIEGRIYLPLRYICESFGEEVEWDAVNSKAYIVSGTEKIDMTGIIVDSRTMIKVRDFEKLGYKVGYEQVEGFSTATIEK